MKSSDSTLLDGSENAPTLQLTEETNGSFRSYSEDRRDCRYPPPRSSPRMPEKVHEDDPAIDDVLQLLLVFPINGVRCGFIHPVSESSDRGGTTYELSVKSLLPLNLSL